MITKISKNLVSRQYLSAIKYLITNLQPGLCYEVLRVTGSVITMGAESITWTFFRQNVTRFTRFLVFSGDINK